MKIIEKIVNSFWVKIVSIIVIILDFTFLIIGFVLGESAHVLHTWGLFLTCIVDIVLGSEILLHFYYLYKKNMEERLLKKAQELNKAKINKKIEMLQSEIEQMNSINKEAMLPQMKQWFDEANKMYTSEDEVTKYVSSKYNEKLVSHEEEMKNLINVTRRVLIDQL